MKTEATELKNNTIQPKPSDNIAIAEIITRLILVGAIFIPAGRLNYWQGWVYVILSTLRLLVARVVLSNQNELLEERAQPGPGVKQWDKFIYILKIPIISATVVIGSLDAGRFRLTPDIPLGVYLGFVILNTLGHSINLWAMRVNRYFSSMVRIQTDRGHEVITDGPYRYIRHPGHLGVILIQLSSAVILGSLWALIPSAMLTVLVFIRTHFEDKTLREELPGYKDYSDRVRYKLIPYVW